ncbi:AAA family ATPase [Palleronia salina]|nr:AAA family ATPase [Palleronia salina]
MPKYDLKPSDVFTPRNAVVNRDMYVSRREIEGRFESALGTSHAILIYGESGNGKSWLYKEFFSSRDVFFCVVDLNTARSEGFDVALEEAYISEPTDIKKKRTRKKGVGLRYVFTAAAEVSSESELLDVRVFERLLRSIRTLAGDRQAFVVFDNLEQIAHSEDELRKLADCIIRVDNERYAAYEVRMLIVGTPGDLREIIARHGDVNTLTNRMRTLPEVGRMTPQEAKKLLQRGFKEFLGLRIESEQKTLDKILFLSDRVAEQVHALALEIANFAVEEGAVSNRVVKLGTDAWLSDSLAAVKDQIRPLMNKKKKDIQRVDQVIFSLGQIQSENFSHNDVESIIEKNFPDTVSGRSGLGVSHIMKNRLSDGDGRIIVPNPNSPTYRISNAKIRMAIRACVVIEKDGTISMKD